MGVTLVFTLIWPTCAARLATAWVRVPVCGSDTNGTEAPKHAGMAGRLPPADGTVIAVRTLGARNQICKSVGIRNQMVGYVFEVELQFGLKSAELGPYYAVKGPFGSRHCVGDGGCKSRVAVVTG